MTQSEADLLRLIEERLCVDALYAVQSKGLRHKQRLERVAELVGILVKQPDLGDVMYLVGRAPHMARLADALIERRQQ